MLVDGLGSPGKKLSYSQLSSKSLFCIMLSTVPGEITQLTTNSSSAAPTANSLRVIHRHGPCFPYDDDQVDDVRILSQDSLRVSYLQNRILLANVSGNAGADNLGDPPFTLPVRNGMVVGSFSYLVTVGIGTPQRDRIVLFDTGGSLTWVKCSPGNHELGRIFDPSNSSSYHNVRFDDPACARFRGSYRNRPGDNCAYRMAYRDSTSSTGLLATETLTLTNTTKLTRFVFGCSHNSVGIREIEGIFGLGRTFPSLLSQTPSSLGKIFSYCLPPLTSTPGHLTIGRRATRRPLYTPMLPPRTENPGYYIDLLGISVGGERLESRATEFSRVGTIIDSGTTFSYLPAEVYTKLSNAFRRGMSQYRLVAPRFGLDTCYDLSNVPTMPWIPITLHFAGSSSTSSVSLTLKPNQIMYGFDRPHVCLAFAPVRWDDGPNIIGGVQQLGLDVIYDLDEQKIGFAHGNCGV